VNDIGHNGCDRLFRADDNGRWHHWFTVPVLAVLACVAWAVLLVVDSALCREGRL